MNKFTLKTSLLSLSAALLLGLSGCSGGGSSSDIASAVSKAYNGIGIDGILAGSTVCIDANDNGVCDTGEPSDVTDAQGQFEISSTTVTGPLLLIGGTDIGTGLPFTGSLTAPAGSTVVTPLTSAVQSLVKSGKSAAEAEANVKAALGVPSDVNLTTFDPFGEVSANAQAVLASQAHLQTIVHAASVAVASADANQTTGSVMGNVFAQISESFDGATGDVNLTVADVTAVTKSVANDLYADNQVALVSVKNNAEATAQSAVDAAEATQASIEAGTPAEAEANLNTGITLVNTSIAADINASTAASVNAADDLNATALQAIVDAQAEQEAREAEIAAAAQAAREAAEALAAAEVAAANAAADDAKAAYDALLEAQAEQLRQAEVERAARAAAEEAAALAAAQEAQLAADQAARDAAAAVAAAELEAAQAQALAEAVEAAARIAAAEAAAEQAALAQTLALAQQAAENAERNAAVNIMKTQAQALVASAYGYIPLVEASKQSIIFIQSLDSNYSADANISFSLGSVTSARSVVGTKAIDTNTSAQDLYDFAQIIADANVTTDANVTEANATLQLVIDNETLAQAQVSVAQTALDSVRARVLEIQAAVALAQAQAAAAVEKQRVIDLIQGALNTANDNNVSTDLAEINATIALAFTDLNATLAIATEYSTLAFDTVTAQTAYDRALAARTEAQVAAGDLNASLTVMIDQLALAQDANTTEVLALAEVTNAVSAATTVATRAGEIAGIRTALATALGVAEGIRDDEILRLQGVEAARIAAAIAASRDDASDARDAATQSVLDANASATQAGLDAAAIAQITNVDVTSFGTTAGVAEQNATTAAGTAQGALTVAIEADVNATAATTEADAAAAAIAAQTAADTAAQAAQTAATAATAAHDALVAAEALSDAAGTPPAGLAFTDGMVFGDFRVDYDGVESSLVQLNGAPSGQVIVTNSILVNGIFVPNNNASTDLEYQDPDWVVESDDGNYTIATDGTAILDNGDMIKDVREVNLTTPDALNAAVLTAVNTLVPGDDNVTFRDGAQAYVFASKRVESFRLYWTPQDYDTNATYSTIIDFMNSNTPVAGIDTPTGYQGVYFQKNDSNLSVDNNGTEVIALANALSGNLVKFVDGNETVVGTWGVTDLPNGELIVALTALDLDSFGGPDEFDNLVAVADRGEGEGNQVMLGEMLAATTDFVEEDKVNFNQIAFEDISLAIEAAVPAVPTINFDGLVGQTIYFESTGGVAGVRTFSPGGLTTGLISNVGEYSGTYTTSGDTITVSTSTGVDTNLTFATQPDFANLAGTVVLVNGTLNSTWDNTTPLQNSLLDVDITYVNDNNGTGIRRFNDRNIAYLNGSVAGLYLFNPLNDMLEILSPTVSVEITITTDMISQPITVSDINGTTTYAGTTTWTVDTNSSTNTAPVAQNDVFVTMIAGETIQGIIEAVDNDANDSLTFTPTYISAGFGPGTTINPATGEFSVVADVNSTGLQAQITIRVSDEANASDEVNLNVNIIASGSGSVSDVGEFSQSDINMTSTEFANVPTVAIPGDTLLHSFWGVDEQEGLRHDTMIFDINSTQIIFSDNENNETIFFTDTLSTGESNASKSQGESTYEAANQIVSFKMLAVEENNDTLSTDLNISMPAGSTAYQAAILMLDAEFDFWNEARDYSLDQNGTVYNSLDAFVGEGKAVANNQFNSARVLVFDVNATIGDNGGNLVEVDVSGLFSGTGEVFVTNQNAGTWSITQDASVDAGNADIILISPNDSEAYENKIYVLDDFGLDVNVTNTVWEGEYREAGRIEVMYYFNDTAAQAIVASVEAQLATPRTIAAIGSWYNATNYSHLVILDDEHYFSAYVESNTTATDQNGGLVVGGFVFNDVDSTVALNDTPAVNSAAAGNGLLNMVFDYDSVNDTLTANGDVYVRDENTSTPWTGAWTSDDPTDTERFSILILNSDDSYLSAEVDLNSVDFLDDGSGSASIYNAFEVGTYTAVAGDNNVTLHVTKVDDYNGEMGPPEADLTFDTSSYPTIINPVITFEKVINDNTPPAP